MFGDSTLNKNRTASWVNPCGEPTNNRSENKVINIPRIFISASQLVQICYKEKAVELVLQLNPLLKYPVQMSKMQLSRGAHT